MPRQPILSVLGHVDSGKCVSPDTRIQLADGSTTTAENLFEDCRANGEKVKDEEGEVYRIDEGPDVFGLKDGKIEKCQVENIWKLEKNQLLEFHLRDGSRIEVTPEHPFLTVEQGELVFKEAEKLEQSEMIAVPKIIPVDNFSLNELKAETLEKLSGDKRILCFVENSFSERIYQGGKKLEQELIVNHLKDCRENNRYRLNDLIKICENENINLKEAYENINELKQSTLKWRAGSTSKRIELPSSMDEFEDLAYSVGLMLGDGNREATKLYNNNQKLRQEFVSCVDNSVGVSTTVKTYMEKVDEVYIECGKTLSKFFEILFDFPVEQKSQSVKLSDFSMKLPENILGSLISGYFDADGYVNKKGGIEVTSASEDIIVSLKTALKRFNISGYISEKEKYHRLHISGKHNLENFSKIGFRHTEKRERFKKLLEKTKKDPVTGITPVSGERIRKARQELGASHTEIEIPYQKRYEEYEKVSEAYLEKFVEEVSKVREREGFRQNLNEKKKILQKLEEKPYPRTEIYEKEEIDHPRLLNHMLSLESEGFIDRSGEKIKITQEGKEVLGKWNKREDRELEKLKKVSESELRFIEVEEIQRKDGGTVYDFTTEAETFIAEDVIVHNTTLLDSIRESRITEGEAGGITQMIGATKIPLDTVEDVCGELLEQLETEISIPGLLFIDTPGHAAFSSLRKRGGSISDIAIVVIDISEGIQPQTEEALEILQQSGTPFVIALNKIDTLHGWKSENQLFTKNISNQNERNRNAIDEKIYELMGDLHEEVEVTADRFDRIDDFTEKVTIVPISAKKGEGIPELLMTVTGLAQNYLQENLEVHEGMGRGSVLETSQEKGLGTTIDVIHYDGKIRKSDMLVYGSSDGVKVTEIRALMEPRPLEEIRLDEKYDRVDELQPASGVKIAGKDLEGAMAGAPIRTCSKEELEGAKREVEEELESVEFETQNSGVVVKADSLGSLEAVMREIEDINVQKAEVGDVTKSDVVEVENEEWEERAILAFNTKATDQAREIARDKGVNIFQSKVIYEIVENYEEWREELEEKKRREALQKVSRPAKIRVLQDHVFNSSKPAVVGVKIVEGVLNAGCSVMTLEGDSVGRVKSVQAENETLQNAKKGDEVAVSISNATVGRDFEEGDELIVNLTGREYRQLQELEDLLTSHEKDVLEEIVEIKDRQDPHWKIG